MDIETDLFQLKNVCKNYSGLTGEDFRLEFEENHYKLFHNDLIVVVSKSKESIIYYLSGYEKCFRQTIPDRITSRGQLNKCVCLLNSLTDLIHESTRRLLPKEKPPRSKE